MGLRNLVIRREAISLPDGQSFHVRGISLFDIMSVIGEFGPQMSLLFGRVTTGGKSVASNDQVKALIADVAREFPEVLAAIIALASDDYSKEGMAIAKQLPMTTQIEAVEVIFGLTFQSEAEVGKLVESLTRMMVAVSGALTKALSPTGIGASGGS